MRIESHRRRCTSTRALYRLDKGRGVSSKAASASYQRPATERSEGPLLGSPTSVVALIHPTPTRRDGLR